MNKKSNLRELSKMAFYVETAKDAKTSAVIKR